LNKETSLKVELQITLIYITRDIKHIVSFQLTLWCPLFPYSYKMSVRVPGCKKLQMTA